MDDNVSIYHTPISSPDFQPQRSPAAIPPPLDTYSNCYLDKAAMKLIISPAMQVPVIPLKGKAILDDHNHVSIPMQEPARKLPNVISDNNPPTKTSISSVSKGSLLPIYNDSTSTKVGETKFQLQVLVNPIRKNLREQELGKTMLVSGMALGALLLTFGEKVGPQLFPAILISLCAGLACLWNGVLLCSIIPDKLACLLQLFGAVCVLFAFFAVIGSFLPLGLVWVSWFFYLACIVPFVMSFFHANANASSPTDGESHI